MAETTNIILEFPESNLEIDLGETITFDQISGFLPVNRIEGVSGLTSEQDGHDIWNNT